MASFEMNTQTSVIPVLRYRDAQTVIEWLCLPIGFEKQLVIQNEDGTFAHAQLTFGNGMVMPVSINDSELGRLMKQPDEMGGSETQYSSFVVPDADAVYEPVRLSDAEIIIEIQDKEYAWCGFSCWNPEDHIGNIDTYNPRQRVI